MKLPWSDSFAHDYGFPVSQLFDAYGINAQQATVQRLSGGRIHQSLALHASDGADQGLGLFAQRLNTQVFPDLNAVMNNIERISAHLYAEQQKCHNQRRPVLHLHHTRHGQALWHDPQGQPWRVFDLIEPSSRLGKDATPTQLNQAAWAYGDYLASIADIPNNTIKTTLAGFHDTASRYRSLIDTANNSPLDNDTETLVKQAQANQDLCRLGQDLPQRLVHNDTKLDNVLFDADQQHALCVIDLDTTMSGLLIHDFGDLVRSAINPDDEDQAPDPKLAAAQALDIDRFSALASGYLRGLGDTIEADERQALALSPQLMAYELGLRFLTDHLMGDLYFGVKQHGDNLRRAANQFTLLQRLQSHESDMVQSLARL